MLYHSLVMPNTPSHADQNRPRTGPGMLHGEPPLQELLSDPIIALVAQSDRVALDELVRLCEEVCASLGKGPLRTESANPSSPRNLSEGPAS